MRCLAVVVVIVTSISAHCQQPSEPLTHRRVCELFSKAVVQVDTSVMHGTGFVTDPDGYIVTAFHVVADLQTMRPYGNTTVSFEGGEQSVPAEIVSSLDVINRTKDFAILKVNKSNLKSLPLGNEDDAAVGAPISVIGLPLTAIFPSGLLIATVPHFCLTGTIAAQTSFPIGNRDHVDTIYFQGVSIKGISGAPIILLDTGKVIGVVDTRMTGLSRELTQLHENILAGAGSGFVISGLQPGPEIDKIIVALDQQLANGLGTGTGAADVAYALKKAKGEYGKHHSVK
jgi:S1-C subfamily serine protease